jgi:hypothetical protein
MIGLSYIALAVATAAPCVTIARGAPRSTGEGRG